MNMKSLFLGTATLYALTGCSGMKPVSVTAPSDFPLNSISEVNTSSEWVQLPKLGSIKVAKLGDSLLSTSRIFGNQEIFLSKPIQIYPESQKAKEMMAICVNNTLPKGRYIAKHETPTSLYYYLVPSDTGDVLSTKSLTVLNVKCENNKSYKNIGLELDKETKEVTPWLANLWNPQAPSLKEGDYKADFITVLNDNNFKQELYYNGKSGSTLKFMYREFSGITLRSNFSQEVIYDLKEGKEIGFKDALIRVIDASNTEIKYEVLSHFSVVN